MIAASIVLFVVAAVLLVLAVLAYNRADRPGDDFGEGAMALLYAFLAVVAVLVAIGLFLLAPTPL